MSARTITSKRSTKRSRSLTKTVIPCRARPRYNSFFSGLTGTPCTNANDGDPYVLYDRGADRWLISDFAFPSFPGSSFWQCIGVSQTNDPVSGGWFLYALQVDPANPTFLGDYPKFALWNDGGTQNAYFLTMNTFSSPLPSTASVFMLSTAPACSLAVPPTRSALLSAQPM